MNLLEEISLEHSKKQKDKIIAWIGDSSERFSEVMEVFLNGNHQQIQRAAWVVGDICKQKPQLFIPYLEISIQQLSKPAIHDAAIRNILRILECIEIPESLQGSLVDICLDFIQDPKVPVAIKAFSISTLENICHHQPELAREICLVLNEYIDTARPAFLSRANRFIKKFTVKQI